MEAIDAVPVQWQQRESRGNYTKRECWETREIGLKVLSLSLLVVSIAAAYKPNFVAQITHLKLRLVQPWISRATAIIAGVVGLRTFICRPLVVWGMGKVMYPMRGNRVDMGPLAFANPAPFDEITPLAEWQQAEQVVVQACDGRRVHTYQLCPTTTPNGEVIVFSFGQGMLARGFTMTRFDELRAMGYTVVCYDPPQYDQTPGPRNPKTDFMALESVIQYLINVGEFTEAQIHLCGQSLGSGAVSEMLSHYAVNGYLCVPFAELEMLVASKVPQVLGATLGHYLHTFLLKRVLLEDFGYHNGEKIAEAARNEQGARSLVIFAGQEDELMGNQPTLLQQKWDENRGGKTPCCFRLEENVGHGLDFFNALTHHLRAEIA